MIKVSLISFENQRKKIIHLVFVKNSFWLKFLIHEILIYYNLCQNYSTKYMGIIGTLVFHSFHLNIHLLLPSTFIPLWWIKIGVKEGFYAYGKKYGCIFRTCKTFLNYVVHARIHFFFKGEGVEVKILEKLHVHSRHWHILTCKCILVLWLYLSFFTLLFFPNPKRGCNPHNPFSGSAKALAYVMSVVNFEFTGWVLIKKITIWQLCYIVNVV